MPVHLSRVWERQTQSTLSFKKAALQVAVTGRPRGMVGSVALVAKRRCRIRSLPVAGDFIAAWALLALAVERR